MVKSQCEKTPVFVKVALRRIKGVHRLSARYNQKIGKPHTERLIELMRHHIEEIEGLVRQGNPHFLVETGDLAVLCLEVLLEHRTSPDAIMEKCFGRYERKLNSLMAQLGDERKGVLHRLKKEGGTKDQVTKHKKKVY